MTFEQILKDIKQLKIQGAEAVAIEAVKSLHFILKKSKSTLSKQLCKEINTSIEKLKNARPTEPAMRNALNFIAYNLEEIHDLHELNKEVYERISKVLHHFKSAKEEIISNGANKIKDGYVVFTHCHSSTVCNILKEAKRQGKKFEVHNTETRPLHQGRITAKELADAGIPVTHYIDSAGIYALKKADICLFGVDAIQSDGRIINKIGTNLFTEIARQHDIPVFFCLNTWKLDPVTVKGKDEEIEMRDITEVWEKPPMKNIRNKTLKIFNPAFEMVNPQDVTGVITEVGVYRPGIIPEIIERKYPFIFRDN